MSAKKSKELARLKGSVSEHLTEAYNESIAQQLWNTTSGGCLQASRSNPDAHLTKRLRTFTPANWAGKPHRLSPMAFASHGWICLSSDMLQCVSCEEYMCVMLPSLAESGIRIFQKTVKKLISMMTDKHSVSCPYRYTSSVTDDAVLLKALSKDTVDRRYESMNKLHLDTIKLDIPEVSSTIIPETVEEKCKALISFGWKKSEHLDDAVVCTYCGRTVGLWLLREEVFNVEKQHYKWCVFALDISRYTDGWQCRNLVLLSGSSSRDLPIVKLAAKAEVWKSAITLKSTPNA